MQALIIHMTVDFMPDLVMALFIEMLFTATRMKRIIMLGIEKQLQKILQLLERSSILPIPRGIRFREKTPMWSR